MSFTGEIIVGREVTAICKGMVDKGCPLSCSCAYAEGMVTKPNYPVPAVVYTAEFLYECGLAEIIIWRKYEPYDWEAIKHWEYDFG